MEMLMEKASYQQLDMLSKANSEDALEHILTTLWSTRKSGLSASQRSRIQSLFNLSPNDELDPVVTCLRSLIRKFVRGNFGGSDVLKLLPSELPLDLQNILVSLFERYENQWKEDLSREPVKRLMQPSLPSLSCSETSTLPQPQQDDHVSRIDHFDFDSSLLIDMSKCVAPSSIQHRIGVTHNLVTLPRLKSMTWTSVNQHRVAAVCLKLQDSVRSPSGEVDVKFQLTKATLEDLLRSMSQISEQLSCPAGSSPRPLQKRQN